MRILLANHVPFDVPEAGPQTRELAERWRTAGEVVRSLIVDSTERGEAHVRRVVCRRNDPQAELAFDVPWLRERTDGGLTAQPGDTMITFSDLTTDEMTRYRDALRRALDAEIAEFDPHLIHVQHIWLLGHLALETGVSYVLTAHGPELAAYRADPRFRRFAEEAAENAGRVIAVSEAVRREVVATFGRLDGRIVLLPDEAPGDKTGALDFYRRTYHAVLRERHGRLPLF